MKPTIPDTLRNAARLLEEYQALGTPEQIRKQMEQQRRAIERLNRRLDAVMSKAREREGTP